MRHIVAAVLLVITFATSAHAQTFKASGLILSDDCEEDACGGYTFQVSKKFVRMPIPKQVAATKQGCDKLGKFLSEHEDINLQICIFQYNGQDILYQTNDGRIEVEAWYIAALAALRD